MKELITYKRMTLFFAWYDFWVGWYWDSEERRLYILPVPTLGFKIKFKFKCAECSHLFYEDEMSDSRYDDHCYNCALSELEFDEGYR